MNVISTCILLGEPAYITGNHALIHSLIYNLCDNAIIYNRDKGDVTVDITSNEDDIVLTVQDTGVGIAKDEQERIFERSIELIRVARRSWVALVWGSPLLSTQSINIMLILRWKVS